MTPGSPSACRFEPVPLLVVLPLLALAPGRGKVDREARRLDGGRPEALVHLGVAAGPQGHVARRAGGVALDRHVEVDRPVPQQQVAHGSADEVRGREPRERREQHVHPGQGPNALGQPLHHSRTGMPAARIRSFASRTL